MKTIQRIAALTAATLVIAFGQPTQAYAQSQAQLAVAVLTEIMKQKIRVHCDETMATPYGYLACLVTLFDEYELEYTSDDIRRP
ncbi:hypothetical protein GJV26_18890 [Massilia dura]|uniref:Uncharacterized protein n=1 Tax=Pseudoduganella dura TaxID=321982 RepID=A0A6I3XPD7_9BURK|nr:hypothetical protein [Pseudoduganella dura]MUI14508.1 hypothetical protein [Pseudoduganella dura]GGY16830.1 hypothetical protein GCM10007386_53240 [Pseudoduganella dura]